MSWRRLLEIIPGFLAWFTILGSVLLAFFYPLGMVYFIILFDLYWLLRILYFLPFLIVSWIRYRRALRRDWQRDVETLPGYEETSHLIFLPTYKEEAHVVHETLLSLCQSAYPSDRTWVVLAGEARDQEQFERIVREVVPTFFRRFRQLFVTLHPADLPEEIPGKGSNLHWAATQVIPQLLEQGIDPDRVIVSALDIDTVCHPQFFSCLLYQYLTIPEPTRSSYQPVALYNNNLWESPAAVRVAMFGTTFWLMTELARPEGMMTFSSHSMSLRMLMDVGYWQNDVVSEDSRIFLQGLIRYHGHYRVTPIHLPLSMDTVMTGNYIKALVALYRQLRRWAWGVEHFPYMVQAFVRDKQMPLWIKGKWIIKQLEGMYTWATAPFLILLLGQLPFYVASDELRAVALFQNTPFTLQWLMRFALVGLFISAALALTMLPARPKHFSRSYAYGISLLQWVLLPVTFVIFGSLPALDAQTRLMLGKSLGFQVSPKRVAKRIDEPKTEKLDA